MAITQEHTRLWARCIGKGSTGPQPYQTPTLSFIAVKVANVLLARNTCHRISSKPYLSLGLFLHEGLDLVGPFKKAKGGFTHIFVAVDKLTKWIEVKPTTSIIAAKVMEFIREIMYWFGVPNNIITNNRTQFTTREFRDFCADAGIKINYASVSHPQSNGQAEWSNSMILQGLKPRIFDKLKPYAEKYIKELSSVLWALHMTLSHTTENTPFSLAYDSEAMLPTEVEHKNCTRRWSFNR
jgi:hypothetical protein